MWEFRGFGGLESRGLGFRGFSGLGFRVNGLGHQLMGCLP